jgi:hypothetical protein
MGNTSIQMTTVSGMQQFGAKCDHVLIVHLLHLCCLRYAPRVAELGAGLAFVINFTKSDSPPSSTFVTGIINCVAAARKGMAKGMKIILVDTKAW